MLYCRACGGKLVLESRISVGRAFRIEFFVGKLIVFPDPESGISLLEKAKNNKDIAVCSTCGKQFDLSSEDSIKYITVYSYSGRKVSMDNLFVLTVETKDKLFKSFVVSSDDRKMIDKIVDSHDLGRLLNARFSMPLEDYKLTYHQISLELIKGA